MDMTTAVKVISALAQKSRLNALRLLVSSGSEGSAASEIARQLPSPDTSGEQHEKNAR